MTLGDSSSPSDVFDSVPFRGAQISSDDDMLPDSLRGYAPVVRGIARTNAQVIIRQNGYIIYQSYVAPGAFAITDMFPTGGSGDLFVTIKEADGSEQLLVVPFASLPVLQREGRFKYSLTGGQYRTYDSAVKKTSFGQGTAIYGLPFGITAYGGFQAATPYQALAFGLGKNMGDFGAFSTDVTQARSTQANNKKDSGQSWRVRYSKNIVSTGTNFAIAGYRYSTSGYFSLQEVLDTYRDTSYTPQAERRRNRAEATLSQNLWEGAGSLSLSLISEDYWHSTRRTQSAGVGYSNSWQGISYSLNYSYNRNTQGNSGKNRTYDKDQLIAFSVSVPLGGWLSNSYANYNVNHSKNGGTSHSLGLSGSSLEGNSLSWSAQQSYSDRGRGNSGNLGANYRGRYGEVTAGFGYNPSSNRVNYGLQGGVLVHENGVTLGQTLGDTVALVKAPGAHSVQVNNQTGVKTDFRGYAIVPYMSPYRKNDVTLATESLPDNVELETTNRSVVPTRGAVVRADYLAKVGNKVLMTLIRQDGLPVPFGATVTDLAAPHAQASIVGDGGQVYLSGLPTTGKLQVKWGNDTTSQCQVGYNLPKKDSQSSIITVNNLCR